MSSLRKTGGCCNFVAQIIGWVLVAIAPILMITWFFSRASKRPDENVYLLLLSIRDAVLGYLCFGLIVLGIARFISYLYEKRPQPGWLLRHTEIFLYVFAILIATSVVIEFMNPSMYAKGISLLYKTGLYLLPRILLKTAQIVILVGLGHILRRILPVIEESKTLV